MSIGPNDPVSQCIDVQCSVVQVGSGQSWDSVQCGSVQCNAL